MKPSVLPSSEDSVRAGYAVLPDEGHEGKRSEETIIVGQEQRVPARGEWTRFYILIIFSIVNCNQCLSWFTFSSVDSEKMKQYFGSRMTEDNIDQLLNWGPIIGAICFPLQVSLLESKNGLQRSVNLGISLAFAGNAIRIVPIFFGESFRQSLLAFVCYHVGQILNAAAGSFIMSSVSRLSAVWFPEAERTTATAIAQMSNGLGTTIGFLLGPGLAPTAGDIPRLLWLGLVVAAIPMCAIVLYFPMRPKHAPSLAAQEERRKASTTTNNDDDLTNATESGEHSSIDDANATADDSQNAIEVFRHAVYNWYASLRKSAKNSSYIVLILAAGTLSGANSAWQGVLQSTLNPVGYSDHEVGWLGFANGLASAVFAIIGGFLMDRVFFRKMKACILVGVAGIFMTSVLFVVCVPNFLYDEAPLSTPLAMLTLLMAINGAATGITSPLFYELAAELLYPEREGVSAGTLVFVLNGVSTLVILVDMVLSYRYINFFYSIVIGAILLSIMFVKEEYKRPLERTP